MPRWRSASSSRPLARCTRPMRLCATPPLALRPRRYAMASISRKRAMALVVVAHPLQHVAVVVQRVQAPPHVGLAQQRDAARVVVDGVLGGVPRPRQRGRPHPVAASVQATPGLVVRGQQLELRLVALPQPDLEPVRHGGVVARALVRGDPRPQRLPLGALAEGVLHRVGHQRLGVDHHEFAVGQLFECGCVVRGTALRARPTGPAAGGLGARGPPARPARTRRPRRRPW